MPSGMHENEELIVNLEHKYEETGFILKVSYRVFRYEDENRPYWKLEGYDHLYKDKFTVGVCRQISTVFPFQVFMDMIKIDWEERKNN